MSNFNDYDKYAFYGDFEIHPKYGQQFKLDHYEIVLSTDEEEILNIYQVPYLRELVLHKQNTLLMH